MTKPYHYVRFRYWNGLDLQQVSEELGTHFTVEMHRRPSEELEMAIHKDDRDELWVTADTLKAMLSRFQAVLVQKKAAPFTPRDMALRAKVFELYPRIRPTPIPMMFTKEPAFEVVKA